MSAKSQRPPTVAELLRDEISAITEPTAVNDVIDRVLQRFQSKAKNPRSSIRTTIATEAGGLFVFVDRDHILPTSIALQGLRFRIPLSQLEIDEGGFAMEYLNDYLPSERTPLENRVQVLDEQNCPMSVRKVVHIEKRRDTIFGEYTDVTSLLVIKDWLKAHHANAGDSLIVNVEDRESFILRLSFETAGDVRQDEVLRRDQQLCDLVYDMLEHSADERLYPHIAIPTVLARLPDRMGYAGSHWRIALQGDERMAFNGMMISYSDAPGSPFERMALGYAFGGKPFTREQGQQVYRFSARFKPGKSKPATIEIQGNQTMFDFDQMLRRAFKHDTWDHLGGFWLLVPRANGRFREVEIGACAPDRDYKLDGSAAHVAVAGLGLTVGSRLKYVYDFGDWIEHELTLEAIEPASVKTRNPRIVN